ncbi:MAG: DUF3450 family protein [Dehalococcoidia bacterium]
MTAGALLAQGATKDAIENTRNVLREWSENRRILSKERQKWALDKQTLEQTIDVNQREVEGVRERIREAQASVTDADKKKAELNAEKDALANTAASLIETIAGLEARTLALMPRLPSPIREKLKSLSNRIPKEAANTTLTLNDRYLNVIGILNEVNKFNREISVESEVRQLEDGSSVQVTALYVGISLGYYVTAKGDAAGIGMPTAAGWEWQAVDAKAAPAIAQSIAILKNEAVAAYVPLPVRIQ